MGKQTDHNQQLLLGLFLVVALSILAFYTLFMTDLQLFGTQVILRAEFPEAHMLREGDAVTVAGKRSGRVRAISFDPAAPPERRITVEMKLTTELVLHEDYSIQIQEATMLGGRVVDIDPGSPNLPRVSTETALPGSVSPNPLASLGDLVSENRGPFSQAIDNIAAVTQGLRDGKGAVGRALTDEQLADDLAATLANLSSTTADARAIAADLREGKGSLGKLLTDDEMYDTVQAVAEGMRSTFEDLSELAAGLREGQGTLGRLMTDDTLGDEVDAAIRSLRSIVDRIDRGEGSVGRLVVNDTFAVNLEKLSTDLAEGKGTIGALLASDELYQDFKAAAEDLREVMAAVRDAEGSLGKFAMESELYDEALIAVQLLNRTLEDYREAAPITSFTSVLFSAF